METAAMAALGAAGSRIAAREEPAGSVESSVVTPMPLPTVSPELPVSSGQGAERGKNLWEQICQGRQSGARGEAGLGAPRTGTYCASGG